MVVVIALQPTSAGKCAHCGRTPSNPRKVLLVERQGLLLCRPRKGVTGYTNCFGLVTLYRHETPCQLCRSILPQPPEVLFPEDDDDR